MNMVYIYNLECCTVYNRFLLAGRRQPVVRDSRQLHGQRSSNILFANTILSSPPAETFENLHNLGLRRKNYHYIFMTFSFLIVFIFGFALTVYLLSGIERYNVTQSPISFLTNMYATAANTSTAFETFTDKRKARYANLRNCGSKRPD